MIVIRPVREEDLDRLFDLAVSIVGGGMTTLPADRDTLETKIALSTECLSRKIEEPGPEYYLLVLEDTETGVVGGTAALFARIGLEKAFYSYKLAKTTHVSIELNRHDTHDVLHLVNDYIGHAEVGSLYLAPEFRKGDNGRTLARSRYLFMAEHRERFPRHVVAEMRGWQDSDGQSPFWDALGQRFFNMSFHEADRLSAIGNNQFIADLMPKFPVYVDFLPKEARDSIGKTHEHAAPALALLKWEGFRYERHVDIFDAGPCVEVRTDDIKAVKENVVSTVDQVVAIDEANGGHGYTAELVSCGSQKNFRLCRGLIKRNANGNILLSSDTASALGVGATDAVRHVPLR